ncbi:MAG: dienelactone hydrolase family protein [Anaerolineales bacterium]|nr:dienelactone hydrolase family protein [Anaerolineales bacterium]
MTQPDGFLAIPSTGKGRALLVLHPWWGLNDTTMGVCTRLAETGFVAFAPDLYHGKLADTIPGAEALVNELDGAQARRDVADALAFLLERSGEPTVAVIGFSLGAYFALHLSTSAPEQVHAVVVFYGTGPGDFGAARAAYLGHFAETDEFEPLEAVEALESALRDAGRPATFFTYPGTGHWFFEPDRTQAYNETAAKLAWDRTLEFLQFT